MYKTFFKLLYENFDFFYIFTKKFLHFLSIKKNQDTKNYARKKLSIASLKK